VEKQKEVRYSKALLKDKVEGSSTPYGFDVLAQLANILTRITLYELLKLSKSTREALREALAGAEVFWLRFWLNHRRNMEKTASIPLNMPPT